jgi:hypothetical protein
MAMAFTCSHRNSAQKNTNDIRGMKIAHSSSTNIYFSLSPLFFFLLFSGQIVTNKFIIIVLVATPLFLSFTHSLAINKNIFLLHEAIFSVSLCN